MRFRPALVGILLLLLVSGAVVAAGTAGSNGVGSAASGLEDATGAATNAADGSPNETAERGVAGFERADPALVVTIQLQTDGNARWHVTYRYLVNGSNETQAFRSFAGDVKSGKRDVGVDRDTFVAFADAASETTGRDMAIRNANWSSSRVYNGTGELTYSFTWTNFGRVEENTVFVGDAFRSPDGTWFPRLYDGQRLVIRPPSELNIVGTPPDKGLDQRALVWDGYREFEPGYLSVVLERPAVPNETTSTTTTPDDRADDDLLSPFLLGVGFALLLVFVGAGSYFVARWQTQQDSGGDGGPPGAPEASDGGNPSNGNGGASAGSASTEAASASGSTSPAPPADESRAASVAGTGGSSVEDAAAAGAGAGAGAAAADAEPAPDDETAADESDGEDDDIDEALLSDEERVVRLLEGNGGRMKQANIVTETGWSNAKVSQLLSGMHEDDEIQKLRIGRENLIALPDENVADFGNDE